MSNPEYQLRLALDALHAGVRALAEYDAAFADDLTVALPDETAEVEDAIVMLARAARHAEALADAAAKMAAETKGRADRFKERGQRLRGLMLGAMDALNLRKIERPDVTLSLRPGSPGVLITDEKMLPEQYIRTKREPDKSAIRDALNAGVVIPGAELANGMPSVQIRSA